MMIRIILVRHGQTSWNRVDRFRGRQDLPLDATGRGQALAAGRYIAASCPPSAVYCSPLMRAVETATAIGDACNLRPQPHPGLIDIDYGEWQGLTPAEAAERDPDLHRSWLQEPQAVHIPDGETLGDVRERAFSALQRIIAVHPDDTIVLVAHTVVNCVLLCAILGLDNSRFWHLRQETAAINIIEWDGHDFTLVSLNQTCHLQSGLVAQSEREERGEDT